MTDAITLHRTAIAAIGANITGITKAFIIPPAKLDTADLPALYVLTSSANNDFEADGDELVEKVRTYRIQVAGIPTGQADPETREGLLAPIIEAVVIAFSSYPNLNNTAGVQESLPKSDSGIVILPEYGMQFVGFEVRLQVTYVADRQFALSE